MDVFINLDHARWPELAHAAGEERRAYARCSPSWGALATPLAVAKSRFFSSFYHPPCMHNNFNYQERGKGRTPRPWANVCLFRRD
jgi:hypothetical protein